jgi:hypothetical protein
MNQITLDHPTYLHEVWCYATNLLGDNATFSSIAELMNQQSAVNPDLPTINITCLQLYWWLKKCKGKEKWTREIPLLKEAHKAARLQHSEHMLTLIASKCSDPLPWQKMVLPKFKKKRAKHLPWAAFEAVGADRIRVRRVINRSHPIKTMFIGVLTCPIPEQTSKGWLLWND